MADQEIEALLQEKGITKERVIEMIDTAYSVAEGKTDASNMLRAAENFMDLLQMKPGKMLLRESAMGIGYGETTDAVVEELQSDIDRAKLELGQKKALPG